MMDNSSDRIDLANLGFEIAVPSSPSESQVDLGYNDEEELEQPTRISCDGHEFEIVAADDVSAVSEYTYDDDDDDDGSSAAPAPRITRKPMPRRTFPRRTMSGRRRAPVITQADLGYEDVDAAPSAAQLGYGDDDEPQQQQYDQGCDTNSGSIRLLAVGRPVRNRRSMGRRLTNASSRRRSTCSGTTASSSYGGGSSKLKRAHSKSRTGPSQRERMVSRSTSRRMSRQRPSLVQVESEDLTASHHQTLQDLGCSELVLDPRRTRMPRRVSLEYGNDGGTATPRRVSLEFDQSKGGNRMPRRVSIGFDQRSTSKDANNTDKRKVLRRRGSLDFSLGTSQLPRRASFGKEAAAAAEVATTGGTRRRASCGLCDLRKGFRGLLTGGGRSPSPGRQNSDSTKSTRLSTTSRRSSVAHIPRKQIASVTAQHRLSLKHVGAVEYLTRDTLVGRSA